MATSPVPNRVERDARGPRVTYEDIEVGEDLGSMSWTVTSESIAGMLHNDEDQHEWYVDGSPFGPPIASPMAIYPPVRVLFSRRYNLRGLFYEFEAELVRPIHLGEELTVSAKVVDKYVKRDREYVTYEGTGHDAEGNVVFRTRRTHVLDFIPRTAPRAGEGLDSGVATRDS